MPPEIMVSTAQLKYLEDLLAEFADEQVAEICDAIAVKGVSDLTKHQATKLIDYLKRGQIDTNQLKELRGKRSVEASSSHQVERTPSSREAVEKPPAPREVKTAYTVILEQGDVNGGDGYYLEIKGNNMAAMLRWRDRVQQHIKGALGT